jgi:hypothetical protein
MILLVVSCGRGSEVTIGTTPSQARSGVSDAHACIGVGWFLPPGGEGEKSGRSVCYVARRRRVRSAIPFGVVEEDEPDAGDEDGVVATLVLSSSFSSSSPASPGT